MSFVGDLLGFGGGGNSGTNFRAQGVDILAPGGLNQTQNSYNQSQDALSRQLQFMGALQGQNGIGNQSSVYNQLQGLANGTGPNPAMAQLENTTGTNVANQAALMAGQRGSGANAGLIARQIGQQGANIQQQAVGQGAALQAQQQLGALGAMGNLANQQVGQQAQGLLGYNQAAQSEQQALLNALAQYNNSRVGMQSNLNNANAGIASTTAQGQQGLFGGLLGGLGSGIASLFAEGGEVEENAPQSFAGKFLSGWSGSQKNQALQSLGQTTASQNMGASALNKGSQSIGKDIGMGIAKIAPLFLKQGGSVVPGKAAVSGNSLQNDKVPAMLSPKEIVLPRSVTLAKDAPEKAKQFVAAVLAKRGRG